MELSVTGTLPPPRCGHTATMVEKRLLVYGGRGKEFYNSSTVIVFLFFLYSLIFLTMIPNARGLPSLVEYYWKVVVFVNSNMAL